MTRYFALTDSHGTILIVTLWMLIILTVFALALGQRASLEAKLAGYHQDALTAAGLARAAIERAVTEKISDISQDVDYLSESWANEPLAFKAVALGEGQFTVSYTFAASTLYGLEDEKGKINLNSIDEQILINFLKGFDVEDTMGLVSSILIWCGKKADVDEEEENFYQSLEFPYHCKKEPLKSIPELLLVRGMRSEILYGEDKDDDGRINQDEQGIAPYITIYASGPININTVSERVLSALIDSDFTDLLDKVLAYRMGLDGQIGTSDDRWFTVGESLNADEAFFDIFGATALEFEKLKTLHKAGIIGVASDTYTVYAKAEVRKVKKDIRATFALNAEKQVKFLSWQRN